jgi:hypothetical protein
VEGAGYKAKGKEIFFLQITKLESGYRVRFQRQFWIIERELDKGNSPF